MNVKPLTKKVAEAIPRVVEVLQDGSYPTLQRLYDRDKHGRPLNRNWTAICDAHRRDLEVIAHHFAVKYWLNNQ